MFTFHQFSATLCGEPRDPADNAQCPHPGTRNTEAFGIAADGTLVGRYTCPDGTHGFILSEGVFSALNVPNASSTYVYGISADGSQLVGGNTDTAGHWHGFRLDAAGYAVLDVQGTTDTVVTGINNAGQLIGTYTDPQGSLHGFLYDGTTGTALDGPGAIATQPQGINDAEQIVGFFQDGNGQWHGFLYMGGTFTALDYPGSTNTYPDSINNSGQIAGSYQDANQGMHGFLYAGGTFTPLDATGGTNTWVHAINDAGQLAGVFQTTDQKNNNQVYVGMYTGAAGWPQQGQIPQALVNTWTSSWWTQIGWPGEPGAYKHTVSYTLALGPDGTYEFVADLQKTYSSWDLCPSGTGMPQGERQLEHDFGTFVLQDPDGAGAKTLVLTVQQGTLSKEDNCNPASNFQYSTAGQVTRLGWQMGVSPQEQLLGLYDFSRGFLFFQFMYFTPQVSTAPARFSQGAETESSVRSLTLEEGTLVGNIDSRS